MATPPENADASHVHLMLKFCVFTLPITAAIGGSLLSVTFGETELYIFKVLVPILFAYLILTSSTYFKIDREVSILILLAVWVGAGMLWADDSSGPIQAALIVIFAAMMFYILQLLGKDVRSALIAGWRLALLGTGMLAVVELVFGWHLPSTFMMTRPDWSGTVALSVFGNPNDYGAFLAVAIPISLYQVHGKLPFLVKALAIFSTGLMVASGSRLALGGLLLFGIVVAIRNRKKWWALPITWIATATIGVMIFILMMMNAHIIGKLLSLFQEGAFGDTSVGNRIGLVGNGLWAAAQSGGMGLGAGGFEDMIVAGEAPIHVRPGIVNPHNFWVEILSELGVVGFVLIIVLICTIWGRIRATNPNRDVSDHNATLLWAALAGYIFAVCTPSSYLGSPVNWAFLATVYVLVRPDQGTIRRLYDDTSRMIIRNGSLPRPVIRPLSSAPSSEGTVV